MSSSPAIVVEQLTKTYRVPVRGAGVGQALRSLVRREYRNINAVADVSFMLAEGEVVGFLGPNGAGKTTTLKMLSGLLHPSGGEARVLGHEPFLRRNEFLRQITLVMGQRNQLIWDIPVIDSFERNRAIYRLDAGDYGRTLEELTELLDLSMLLQQPARNLSLGERMKCEVAVALLHRPRVLFLDEPTIGLDVTMQRRIREFVDRYNRETGATVLLTSHYMADVEALCKRVVVIHQGWLLFDGQLSVLLERFTAHKTVVVQLASGADADLSGYGEVVDSDGVRVTLRVAKAATAEVASRLLQEQPVADLTIEDTPIAEVIERVFSERLVP